MSLRVLLVTSEFPPDVGGIATHVHELAKGLSSEVDEVSVVHPRSFAAENAAFDRFLFAAERPRLIKAEPFYQLILRWWLRNRLKRGRFDLIHVHGMRPLGATRGLPIPIVFTNHSSGFLARLRASSRRKVQTSRLLRHVSHLIGPSGELIEAARMLGYHGPATMIPNGVDIEQFNPGQSPVRTSLGIGADEVVILLARRLVEKNGVVWFARALAQLGGRKFRVVIAGDGKERGPMQAILGETGMLERTIFLGAVVNKDMTSLYRAADLSVLPSLAEATSIAGLEAMATGLPLVGTRVGGIPTIIEDDVTGFLVEPRDPDAMAQALDRLIADGELRRRMGRAARAKVEREFSWSMVVGKTVEVYRTCLGAKRL